MPPVVFKVDRELKGSRLTRAMSLRVERLSIHRAKEVVDRGRVFVNEKRILTGSTPLSLGDVVEIHLHGELTRPTLGPEAVLWESSGILVINKPAGIAVEGSQGVTEDTLLPLLERMLHATNRWRRGDRLTLVHRLDRDTTGALLVARNARVGKILEDQFRGRVVEKRYLVLAEGSFSQKEFEQRSAIKMTRKATSPGSSGKAVTRFRVLEEFPGCALLEALPETGRTHQIRIHLAKAGHPVLGDIVYGPKRIKSPIFREIPRQMLHALNVGFRDPQTGIWTLIEAPLSRDMEHVLDRLRVLAIE